MKSTVVNSAVILVPVSASDAIKRKLVYLNEKRRRDGLQALTKHEWALTAILNQANAVLLDGRCEFNADELRTRFVDGLHDEGVDAWRLAFDAALADALANYLMPHPDSQ